MTYRKSERDSLPFLNILPNLVTILGLCAGLTSIRFVLVGRYDLAAVLIIFAALIDGLDGLLARRLDATSTFGAELDTLSDFLNFGVAPALLVFQFALADARDIGWIFVLVYSICCCLRLARFNVTRDAPAPAGRAHLIGAPAPAGAILAMLPVFLSLGGVFDATRLPLLVGFYLGLVGLLMVGKMPTYSSKSLRISRDKTVWVLIGAAIVAGVVLTRFWLLMVVVDAVYALTLVHCIIAWKKGKSI